MKIIFFTYLPLEYGGGTAKYFREVSTGLKKRHPDLEISIVTFDYSFARKILFLYSLYFFNKYDTKINNKETTNNIEHELGRINYYKAKNFRDLSRLLQNADVIYSKNDILEASILRFMTRPARLPIIFGFHTPVFYPYTNSIQSKLHNLLYRSSFYKLLLNRSSKLHVMNSFDESLLKKRFPYARIVKIYNPFDFSAFEKKFENSIRKKSKDKKPLNILWVGRLTEQKGVDDLLLLINTINASEYKKQVAWSIVGDGELRHQVSETQKKWGNVNFYGYVKNDKVGKIYKESDLLISTSKWESFPYNLLEAQAFGLPVICYNIQGCSDIITNDKNGILVNSLSELIGEVKKYIDTPRFKKEFINIYIRKKFSLNEIYKNLYNLLR